MPPNHFICSCCGKSKPDTQRILLGGDALCYACAEEFTTLCDRCAEEFTTLCDRCGERVYRRDAIQVNHRILCPQCCGKVRAQN